MDEAGVVYSLMDSIVVLSRTADEAVDNLCEGFPAYPASWS
ncbi:hypothetical protein [Marinitenerispora sediminis]|nr:hypothetical protein [Marinitenerispora sediminis]